MKTILTLAAISALTLASACGKSEDGSAVKAVAKKTGSQAPVALELSQLNDYTQFACGEFFIYAKDAGGNRVDFPANAAVILSTDSPTGTFYHDASCSEPMAANEITVSGRSPVAYYRERAAAFGVTLSVKGANGAAALRPAKQGPWDFDA